MPIPDFRNDGWLPEGHHRATWEEISECFGGEAGGRRSQVLLGLLAWRDAAQSKGLSGYVVLDGSFVSTKPNPGDFDLIFVYDATSEKIATQDIEARGLLDPTQCKARFGGDVFAFAANMVKAYPQFFPMDTYDRVKFTDIAKGVLEVDL